jgi:hypothetical protein
MANPGKPKYSTIHAVQTLLARYQRIRDTHGVLWREKGEAIAELPTLRHCIEHAGIGGFSAGSCPFPRSPSLTPSRGGDAGIEYTCRHESRSGIAEVAQGPQVRPI